MIKKEKIMTKILLPLLLILSLVSVVQASPEGCYSALTDNYSQDSRNFSLDLAEMDTGSYGRDYQAEGIFVVRQLIKKLGCSKSDINFGNGAYGRTKHKCSLLVIGRPHSAVCYIETSLGYFFITKDFFNTANISYSRWD